MSERDTFGPRLQRERERRGISLETISTLTNVGIELWEGLERNDFSRWPRGIFARAFIRDYARAVGLDADEIVDEFCRLFPLGDRRTSRVIRAQAELIGHQPEYRDEPELIPGGQDRRATDAERRGPAARAAAAQGIRIAPRVLAVAFDTAAVCASGTLLALVTPMTFWPSLGLVALLYYGAATVASGATPGARLTEVLQQRVPTLFAAAHRGAHA